jgi:hypothetical protein
MLPKLIPLNQQDNFDLRHFSGTVTCSTTFNIDRTQPDKSRRLFLDLVPSVVKVFIPAALCVAICSLRIYGSSAGAARRIVFPAWRGRMCPG